MAYQDLGAWAPGEDPGTLYGDPRLNQRARPGGKSYSIMSFFYFEPLWFLISWQQKVPKRDTGWGLIMFIAWCHVMSNYSIPISNKYGTGSRGVSRSKGCFPGKKFQPIHSELDLTWIFTNLLHRKKHTKRILSNPPEIWLSFSVAGKGGTGHT